MDGGSYMTRSVADEVATGEPSRAGVLGRSVRTLLAGAGLAALLAGCANTEEPADNDEAMLGYEEPSDPLELPNRFVFAFNETLDTFILQPLAVTYDFWLPSEIKNVVRNFTRYVSSPVILANDVMQGEWERAEDTAARLVANSVTAGLGDLVKERHPYHDEDFGQTMAVHGVDDGFYLVLPIVGPSSARDGVGLGVDYFLHPLTYVDGTTTFSLATRAAAGVDLRARNLGTLADIKRDSVDFYARMRSLYYQRRQAAIENRNGTGPMAQTEQSEAGESVFASDLGTGKDTTGNSQ